MSSIVAGVYTPTKRGYAGRQRARWVLASANDRVLYSKGAQQHYECKATTFRAWMKRTDAKKDLEWPAELQLEPQ